MRRLTNLLAVLLLSVSSMAQTKVELAQQAIDNEDYILAIQYSTEYLDTSPNDVDALVIRSTAYLFAGNLVSAFADLNNAIKYWNKHTKSITLSQLYIYRAYLYQRIEDDKAALADLNTAIERGKQVAENYEARADYYYEREEYALAEADYRTAAQLEPANDNYQIEIAMCLLKQMQYDKAEIHLQKLVKLYPNNDEIQRLYAVTLLYKEEYKSFIDSYILYMVEAEQSDISLLCMAAEHEFIYAIKAVSKQVAISSDSDYWKKIRARLYREHRQYTEALNDLRQVEKNSGDSLLDAFTVNEIALCYEGLEDFSMALRYYTKLIKMREEHNVPDAFSYLKRGIIYRELGEYDKTIADCDKALSVSMDYASYAYYLRGWAHELGKNNAAAFEDYNKSIMFDDTYAYAYLMRGTQHLVHRHDTIHAMLDFERILELDTTITGGSCRHYALMFLGKIVEAKAWMAQILEAEPDDAGHYYDAACLYARMGEAEEAVGFLRKAFEHGFRRFQHLEVDDDMDDLRNRQDYKDLIDQYKKEKITNLFNRLNS